MKGKLKRTFPIYLAATVLLIIIGAGVADAQVQLDIQSGVQLSWPTSTNKTYVPQWSSNPGGPWTDLSASAPGTGTTNTLYDPFPSGARSYQVLEIVPGVPAS